MKISIMMVIMMAHIHVMHRFAVFSAARLMHQIFFNAPAVSKDTDWKKNNERLESSWNFVSIQARRCKKQKLEIPTKLTNCLEFFAAPL